MRLLDGRAELTAELAKGQRIIGSQPEAHRVPEDAGSSSVVDCLNTKSPKSLNVVLHGLERFGGVPLPIRDLARDP